MAVQLGSLVLTGRDGFGCDWVTLSPMPGWDGSPASSSQSTQRSRQAGAWGTPGYLGAQPISLSGFVTAPSADGLQDALDRLKAAVTLDDTILTVVRGSKVRSRIVRRQDVVDPQEVNDVTAAWSVGVVALDPRVFAPAVSTASVHLPSVSGGFTFPMSFPMTISATISTGQALLNNPGNTNGPVLVRVNGPMVAPVVIHKQTGLVWSSSQSLGSGEFLLVDMEARSALLNGQASRINLVTSRGWMPFSPGANEYDVSATSGTGSFVFTAVPAWQ